LAADSGAPLEALVAANRPAAGSADAEARSRLDDGRRAEEVRDLGPETW
jgi:hypothetical protein